MEVTTVWSLDKTSSDVLAFSKGIMEAATSDNVQPIALLACEAFGATLPMSSESMAKVHQLCSQSHDSAVIRFMKMKVGYKRGDSGWQLAQSDAGLRFLGLAACLETMDHWPAAETLKELIRETASNRLHVPTSHQINKLLQALHYRLARSGFLENVTGWCLFLREPTSAQIIDPKPPTREEVKKLVQAVSEIGRLGQVRKLHVRVSYVRAAWTIAFLQWILGTPPSIVQEHHAMNLDQTSSTVLVRVCQETSNSNIRLALFDEIENITELVVESSHQSCNLTGMIDVSTYGKMLLEIIAPKDSLPYLAHREAIQHACGMASEMSVAGPRNDQHSGINDPYTIFALNEIDLVGTDVNLGACFSKQAIFSRMTEFLGGDVPPCLEDPAEGLDTDTLPLIKSMRESACTFRNLEEYFGWARDERSGEGFERNISYCTAIILLISLLTQGYPHGLLLNYRRLRRKPLNELTRPIHERLEKGHHRIFLIHNIFWSIHEILGHDSNSMWMASSYHGQTIYPEIYETQTLHSRDWLNICCVVGELVWGEESYTLVQGAQESSGPGFPRQHLQNPPEGNTRVELSNRCPENVYAPLDVVWNISALEDRLVVSPVVPQLAATVIRALSNVISHSANALFIDCPHDRMARISSEDPCVQFRASTDPLEFTTEEDTLLATTAVVQCNDNEQFRFVTLAEVENAVVRCDACLECCLKVARFCKISVVIC